MAQIAIEVAPSAPEPTPQLKAKSNPNDVINHRDSKVPDSNYKHLERCHDLHSLNSDSRQFYCEGFEIDEELLFERSDDSILKPKTEKIVSQTSQERVARIQGRFLFLTFLCVLTILDACVLLYIGVTSTGLPLIAVICMILIPLSILTYAYFKLSAYI